MKLIFPLTILVTYNYGIEICYYKRTILLDFYSILQNLNITSFAQVYFRKKISKTYCLNDVDLKRTNI